MKTKLLTVGKTYNTGNYTSTRVEMTFEYDESELMEGELTQTQIAEAQQHVDWAFRVMMDERKPWLNPQHEKWGAVYKAYKAHEITLEDVRKVYRITDENVEQLNK